MRLVLGCGLFAVTAGCGGPGGDGLSDWVGVYQLSAKTENTTACDAEGPSVLAQEPDKFFVAVDAHPPRLDIVSCPDVASCDATAASVRAGSGYAAWYSYELTSDAHGSLAGTFVTTGTWNPAGTCDMPQLIRTTATRLSPTSIRIEARTYTGDSHPQNAQGFCTTSDNDATTSSPCSYDALIGDFVAALPS